MAYKAHFLGNRNQQLAGSMTTVKMRDDNVQPHSITAAVISDSHAVQSEEPSITCFWGPELVDKTTYLKNKCMLNMKY